MESSNCFNKIADQCEIYFSHWEGITNFTTDSRIENAITILKVASAVSLIFPVLVGITWMGSTLIGKTVDLISSSSIWNRMFSPLEKNVMEYMDESWFLRMRQSARDMQSYGLAPNETYPINNSSTSKEGSWHYNAWHDEENNFCEKVLFSGGQLSVNVSGAIYTINYPRTEKSFINEIAIPLSEIEEEIDKKFDEEHGKQICEGIAASERKPNWL